MPINIYEQPITPSADLDEVIVYVPGYSVKGPSEPTLVKASNFTAIFGDSAYQFSTDQSDVLVTNNKALQKSYEKSWKYAKDLVDSGLTVLFKRFKPSNAPVPSFFYSNVSGLSTPSISVQDKDGTNMSPYLKVSSKYFGIYYNGLTVIASKVNGTNGVSRIEVKSGEKILESKLVSFDSSATNYFATLEFDNIVFEAYTALSDDDANKISLEDACLRWISDKGTNIYLIGSGELTTTETTDNFSIKEFEEAVKDASIFSDLKDTETYPVSYITAGGYWLDSTTLSPANALKLANSIKAVFPVDLQDDFDVDTFETTIKDKLLALGDPLDMSQGFFLYGCDTYSDGNTRSVYPESYGYFIRLGKNISNNLPAYTPTANNSQGIISNGLTTSRKVDKLLEDSMISKVGCSVNPIIYKKNVGYVIMGNRTLYPNNGVLAPQSFLNCRLVVNSVERSARRSANKLRIVSTNSNTAFKTFSNDVSKTCDKMLTNGDGLAAYDIIKLKKTEPATLNISIHLVVVEGIETFNIYVPYELQLD